MRTAVEVNPIETAAAREALHPGETPAEYRERIGHASGDPGTWGPLDRNPDAYLVGVTVRLPGCGCDIVGNGTIPYPLSILQCPLHKAAAGLLDAIVTDADERAGDLGATGCLLISQELVERARALLPSRRPQ